MLLDLTTGPNGAGGAAGLGEAVGGRGVSGRGRMVQSVRPTIHVNPICPYPSLNLRWTHGHIDRCSRDGRVNDIWMW